jgi:hypothetical protein
LKHRSNCLPGIGIAILTALYLAACGDTGGSTIPVMYSCAPDVPGIVLYYSINAYTGDVGGRTIADGNCDSVVLANLETGAGTVDNKHAFASFDAGHAIADMPARYLFSDSLPVFGPDGCTVIANSWADLVDGTIDRTLEATGVLPAGSAWWSGSDADGTLADFPADYTCSGFSDDTTGSGAIGVSNRKDASWIRSGEKSCADSYYFLCTGVYTPAP